MRPGVPLTGAKKPAGAVGGVEDPQLERVVGTKREEQRFSRQEGERQQPTLVGVHRNLPELAQKSAPFQVPEPHVATCGA